MARNAYYKDDAARAVRWLAEHGIEFVDAGVSGGVWGLENGYCLMFGGERCGGDAPQALHGSAGADADQRLAALRAGRLRAFRQDGS